MGRPIVNRRGHRTLRRKRLRAYFIWHFPSLDPQAPSTLTPESITPVAPGSRHDGHVLGVPLGGNGSDNRPPTPVHHVGRGDRARIRPL